MLQIVRKTNHETIKELTIFSAEGRFVDVDGTQKELLKEGEELGKICLDEFKGNVMCGGTIAIDGQVKHIRFERVKPPKWNGRVGKLRVGYCFDSSNTLQFQMDEKLRELGSWWIFKSGYVYYELEDKQTEQKYTIKDITFAADMHYYYIYNEQLELVAAIYKPWREPGHDEYRIYAKESKLQDVLLFVIAYVDFFLYPFNKAYHTDDDVYHDDAAYQLSEDELLGLYDENFTRGVIRNER